MSISPLTGTKSLVHGVRQKIVKATADISYTRKLGNFFCEIVKKLLNGTLKLDKECNNLNKLNGKKFAVDKDKQGTGAVALLDNRVGHFTIKAVESGEEKVDNIKVRVIYEKYFNKNSDISKTLNSLCHEIYEMEPDKITREVAKLLAVCAKLLESVHEKSILSIGDNKKVLKEYNKLKDMEKKFYNEYYKIANGYSKKVKTLGTDDEIKETAKKFDKFRIEDVKGKTSELEKTFLDIEEWYKNNYAYINGNKYTARVKSVFDRMDKVSQRWINEYENKLAAMGSLDKKTSDQCKNAVIVVQNGEKYSYNSLVESIDRIKKDLYGELEEVIKKENELKESIDKDKLKKLKAGLNTSDEKDEATKEKEYKEKLNELRKSMDELSEKHKRFEAKREQLVEFVTLLKNAKLSKEYKALKKEAVGMHSLKYNSELKKRRKEKETTEKNESGKSTDSNNASPKEEQVEQSQSNPGEPIQTN